MVQCGDFKIELVYADTKIPFKEHVHTKDGKIYVEVEPDVEYFISTQRIRMNRGATTIASFSVDEKELSTYHCYIECKDKPSYKGISRRQGLVSTKTALKFTKPLISQDGTGVNRDLLMGKVEIKMYDCSQGGYKEKSSDFTSTFTAATVDLEQSGLAKKKSLRSGEGEITITKNHSGKRRPSFILGEQFDTVTLNYCTALGLMEVGVLEKPDLWTHHRMKRPAEPDQGGPRVRPKHIQDTGAVGSKTVELFDLCATDSDDGK
jgi:hypothetical protein